MTRTFASFAMAALTAAALSLPAPAAAQSGNISLELNGARDENGSCSLFFLVTNNTGTEISDLAYEVVMFDANGTVDELLTFGFGSFPQDRTRVRKFIFADRACSDFSRVLVNDVAACTGEGGATPNCMDGLVTSSRVDIDFGL